MPPPHTHTLQNQSKGSNSQKVWKYISTKVYQNTNREIRHICTRFCFWFQDTSIILMPWFFILVQPEDIYMAFSVFMTITQKTEDTNLDVAPLDQVKIYILSYSLCNADLN